MVFFMKSSFFLFNELALSFLMISQHFFIYIKVLDTIIHLERFSSFDWFFKVMFNLRGYRFHILILYIYRLILRKSIYLAILYIGYLLSTPTVSCTNGRLLFDFYLEFWVTLMFYFMYICKYDVFLWKKST